MSIGPVQAFVIGFPDNDLFEGRIADELLRLSEVGQIRIIDAVFVMREQARCRWRACRTSTTTSGPSCARRSVR